MPGQPLLSVAPQKNKTQRKAPQWVVSLPQRSRAHPNTASPSRGFLCARAPECTHTLPALTPHAAGTHPSIWEFFSAPVCSVTVRRRGDGQSPGKLFNLCGHTDRRGGIRHKPRDERVGGNDSRRCRTGRIISPQVSTILRKAEMELAAHRSPVKFVVSWLCCLFFSGAK